MSAVRSDLLFSAGFSAAPRIAQGSDAFAADPELLSEADFLRRESAHIEQEIFLRRFANWRLSLAGMAGLAWMIAAMYRYLDATVATLHWALLETLSLVSVGVVCATYERWRPRDLNSMAQRRWVGAWTVASVLTSAVTGALPWFLPAERLDAQFSSAALLSILMIAFVMTRANRLLIRASVGTYLVSLSVSLALHARMPWAVPVCLVFTAMLLGMGMMLNASLRQAIGDQLYARYLHGELRRSHARQLAVQQREAALNERQRMMSDLHDGFGALLIGSLRQLESGQIGVQGAVAALRECSDDLRHTVDAHEPAARNLATLLGMLRYRMQPRIEAAGLRLNWCVEELPNASLPPAQSLDLLRILQQCISNVLQHADAREMNITAHQLSRQLEIAVEDDGKGMDPQAAAQQGRGIASMQRRAARLGAELLLEARAGGGTTLRLRWSLDDAA